MADKKSERSEPSAGRGKTLFKSMQEARERAAIRELRRIPSLWDENYSGSNTITGPVAQSVSDEIDSEGSVYTGYEDGESQI